MKKYLLILLLFLLPCNLKADIPAETLGHLASSWLYEYDATDYDLTIHPYTVNSIDPNNPPPLGEMGIIWDLNSDGTVNLQDFSTLSQMDMTQLIEDTKGLQGKFSEEYMQTSLTRIMDKQKELGIDDLRLFKILLFESGFEVNVYNYSVDWLGNIDLDYILFWENETHYGTIDMKFKFEFLFDIPIGYDYTYTYKYYVKGQ